MTVGELKDILEQMDDDALVRLAHQPNYPLHSHVADAVWVQPDVDEDDTWGFGPNNDPEAGILFIVEGGQVHDAPYLPGAARRGIGW
jgi:hypothetical protein